MMLRRKFLSLLGLAPLAAVVPAVAASGEIANEFGDIGCLDGSRILRGSVWVTLPQARVAAAYNWRIQMEELQLKRLQDSINPNNLVIVSR